MCKFFWPLFSAVPQRSEAAEAANKNIFLCSALLTDCFLRIFFPVQLLLQVGPLWHQLVASLGPGRSLPQACFYFVNNRLLDFSSSLCYLPRKLTLSEICNLSTLIQHRLALVFDLHCAYGYRYLLASPRLKFIFSLYFTSHCDTQGQKGEVQQSLFCYLKLGN